MERLAIFTLCTALILSACSRPMAQSKSQSERTPPQPDLNKLSSVAQELQNNVGAEVCDTKNAQIKIELSLEIEKRAKEIVQFQEKEGGEKYRIVPIGPINFREYIKQTEALPGWRDDIMSWSEAYDLYAKIKGTPMGGKWQDLARDVRRLLADDQLRLSGNRDYFVDETSGVPLDDGWTSLETCLKDSHCSSPDFTPDSRRFFQHNPYYAREWTALETSKDPNSKRAGLQSFLDRVKEDYWDYFEFRKEASIVRSSKEEITVPMNAGDFLGFETQFSEIIEKVWRESSLKIKILWRQAPKLYFLEAGKSIDLKPNVRWDLKKMTLPPNTSIKSISHEFGHVLGFSDEYFPRWDSENCFYRFRTNEEDIMSDSRKGMPTSSEWRKLDSKYPWKN